MSKKDYNELRKEDLLKIRGGLPNRKVYATATQDGPCGGSCSAACVSSCEWFSGQAADNASQVAADNAKTYACSTPAG